MNGPVALNANTTYGIDTSAENSYGMGKSYVSPHILRRRQKAQDAAPSIWWLVGALLVLAVL